MAVIFYTAFVKALVFGLIAYIKRKRVACQVTVEE